jgi:hypothetical protein
MTGGELATRWTVRLALVCCFARFCAELPGKTNSRPSRVARAAWTGGWMLFLLHVACAFHFYHHWSHADAYLHTAQRTAELVGWNWGGGLYFNYAFTAAWTFDTLGWWCSPSSRRGLPRAATIAWHAYFFLMVANATIVFETGIVRWAGAVGLALLGIVWIVWRRETGADAPRSPERGAAGRGGRGAAGINVQPMTDDQ